GRIDPIADIETIETELMLADLESLERRVEGLEKRTRGSDKEAQEAKETLDLVQRALALLLARTKEEEKPFCMLALLTSIPVLYVANVSESAAAEGDALSRKIEARAQAEGAGCVSISAKIEA